MTYTEFTRQPTAPPTALLFPYCLQQAGGKPGSTRQLWWIREIKKGPVETTEEERRKKRLCACCFFYYFLGKVGESWTW